MACIEACILLLNLIKANNKTVRSAIQTSKIYRIEINGKLNVSDNHIRAGKLRQILHDDGTMLNDEEIMLLKQWVDQGALHN